MHVTGKPGAGREAARAHAPGLRCPLRSRASAAAHEQRLRSVAQAWAWCKHWHFFRAGRAQIVAHPEQGPLTAFARCGSSSHRAIAATGDKAWRDGRVIKGCCAAAAALIAHSAFGDCSLSVQATTWGSPLDCKRVPVAVSAAKRQTGTAREVPANCGQTACCTL